MGHLRTGTLPDTPKWKAVVEAVASAVATPRIDVADISNKTLEAARQGLKWISNDEILQHCFQFLVVLAVAGQYSDVRQAAMQMGIPIQGDPTKLSLSRSLRLWLDQFECKRFNPEFAALARQSTADTIVAWVNEHSHPRQLTLLPEGKDLFHQWRDASDGQGFCRLSRVFFAKFMTRYLNYFLSRAANFQIDTVEERYRFEESIRTETDVLFRHSFEASRIIESFSAGWFNKRGINRVPTLEETEGFLRHAFEKMREEMRQQRGTLR